MTDAFKALGQQLAKGAAAAPGWLPLLVLVSVAVESARIVTTIPALGYKVTVPSELVVLLLTFVLYKIGDAIDDVVFKTEVGGERDTRPRFKQRYQCEYDAVSQDLGVTGGTYAVSVKLLTAAERDRPANMVLFLNEMGKCLRSLPFPLLLAATLLIVFDGIMLAAVCVVGAFLTFPLYLACKIAHVQRLYRTVSEITKASQYGAQNMGLFRFYFWRGVIVTSALAAKELSAQPGEIIVPSNTPTLDRVFQQIRESADMLLANELSLPTLILIYSIIDTLGWVNRPAAKDSSDRHDFMAWVNDFLLPASGISATAEDLYAARCGVVHSHSFESTMSRMGKARRILYSYGRADHRILEQLAANHAATDVALKIETLIAALDAGFAKFKAALATNPAHAQLVDERAAKKFFAFVPTPKSK